MVSTERLMKYMSKRDIGIAAIQETKLSTSSRLQHKDGYSIICKDRSKKGGGLAFLIHDTIMYRTIDIQNVNQQDQHLEQQAVVVTSGTTDITIVNYQFIYSTPQ